jgi:peptidoglycan/xylan/chitin deacetylase (PgdA/CDA1 family)
MHPILKGPIERALSSASVSRIAQQRLRGKRLIIAYHGIIPHGAEPSGERSLFLRQRDFAAQLDMLSEVLDIASLDRIDDEGDGRPRAAITIDDAYQGAVCVGVRELVKRGLPATIFVAPARLEGHVFWWDALAANTGRLEDSVRNHALNGLNGLDERVRAWASRSALLTSDALPEYARAATRAELHAAASLPGITLGSHTWSHTNLSKLTITEILSEVTQSRTWLRREFPGRVVDWLAYPYGIDCVAAHQALADSSYTGALRNDGGWHRPARVSPFARPRLNVPASLSVAGLKARALGSLPS